jgi:site-specific recombinase XerD
MWERLANAIAASRAPVTVYTYMQTLEELCRVMKAEPGTDEAMLVLTNLTKEDAAEYVNWCKRQKSQKGRSSLKSDTVSLGTIKKKLNAITTCYKELITLGIAKENPFAELRDAYQKYEVGDRRPTKLTPFDKVKALLAIKPVWKQDFRDLALLAMCYGSAARRATIAALRLIDLEFQPDGRLWIQLRNTKAQTARLQYVLPWAVPNIKRYYEMRKQEGAKPMDGFFIAYRGRSNTTAPISDETLYAVFREWMPKIGLDETYTPHSARATAITFLLENNLTHRRVCDFSGHKSVQMVEKYDKLRNSSRPDDFDVEL